MESTEQVQEQVQEQGGEQREELLTPGEVALEFRVDPKTVTRWVKTGLIEAQVMTPGGHRRFTRAYIEEVKRKGLKRYQRLPKQE